MSDIALVLLLNSRVNLDFEYWGKHGAMSKRKEVALCALLGGINYVTWGVIADVLYRTIYEKKILINISSALFFLGRDTGNICL